MQKKKTTVWATIGICAVGLAFNLWFASNNGTAWGVDFNQFYAASHLAGTGDLYNWDKLRKAEAENGPEVPTGRVPLVSFVEKSVTWLPYAAAHMVWLALSAAALLAFALLWPGMDRSMMLTALCWSIPASLLLILGQDTPFWLLSVALGLLLLERKHPVLAGVAFSFCICKYHLAVGIPIFLVAQKRWSTLAAGAAAGAAWLAASFAIEGPSWPRLYLAAITDARFSPAPERMPNLRGIASWLPAPRLAEALLAAVVVVLVFLICRKCSNVGEAGAIATAAGLILAHHGYANDCTLLVPLVALIIARQNWPFWIKFWALVQLTPIPTLLIATPRPLIGQFLIVGLVVAAMARELYVPAKVTEPALLI
ncbi:MAG TPA: glycosyltransferase 87 family protein [Candidatus Sulfopaludibacter sp.]|jgi:hypothetical protein|nr:glycosyltransferase 87 family protein [Candidatus Sulfopaludibacter sp.]